MKTTYNQVSVSIKQIHLIQPTLIGNDSRNKHCLFPGAHQYDICIQSEHAHSKNSNHKRHNKHHPILDLHV